MTTQLLIANKRNGKIWDASGCTESVTWTTNRTGSPGTLKFTVIKSGDLDYLEGDVVRFSVDGQLVFYGWVGSPPHMRGKVNDMTRQAGRSGITPAHAGKRVLRDVLPK